MGTMSAFYRIAAPTMTASNQGPSFTVGSVVPFSLSVATLRLLVAGIANEAMQAFADASNQPIKQFAYTGSDLTSVEYRDAGNVLIYTATLNYTGSDLTSVLLERASDSETWTKTLTYTGSDLTELEAA